MNYAGFDVHAHNRATRRFGSVTRADLILEQHVACPFCGVATTVHNNIIRQHVEYHGFTICPVSGMSLSFAEQRAATLMDDYRLPCECEFGIDL